MFSNLEELKRFEDSCLTNNKIVLFFDLDGTLAFRYGDNLLSTQDLRDKFEDLFNRVEGYNDRIQWYFNTHTKIKDMLYRYNEDPHIDIYIISAGENIEMAKIFFPRLFSDENIEKLNENDKLRFRFRVGNKQTEIDGIIKEKNYNPLNCMFIDDDEEQIELVGRIHRIKDGQIHRITTHKVIGGFTDEWKILKNILNDKDIRRIEKFVTSKKTSQGGVAQPVRSQGGVAPPQGGVAPSQGEVPIGTYDISDFTFTQEIDCALALNPVNEEECKAYGCKGVKTTDGVNKCYDVNYDDIIRQFVDNYNFTALKSKSVLPTPDRGACLFISIVESIFRDNKLKLKTDFNSNTERDNSTNPKVTYEFNNNYLNKEALNLRNCVVDFIVHHWDNQYVPFGAFIEEPGGTYTKEDYFSETNPRSMRNPGTYAGEPEIIAIATLLNINIHVLNISPDVTSITYNKFEPNPDLIKPEGVCNQYNHDLIDVYIVYKLGNHYFALVSNL